MIDNGSWMTVTPIEKTFRIQKADMVNAGVNMQIDDRGRERYELADLVDKCGHIMQARLSERFAGQSDSYSDLKVAKLREEVTKLSLVNRERSGELVDAASVQVVMNKGVKSICDVLDGIPSQVRMENPELPQSAIDSVNRVLTRVRNNAADLKI